MATTEKDAAPEGAPVTLLDTSLAAARRAGRAVDYLLERPRLVLGTLIGAQIAAIGLLAASIPHSGWLYFHNGDQVWIATQGWLLGQLELPPTEIGYLWSLVLSPIMWVTGPTFVQAIPPVMALNVLVLGPIALLCVYGIAAQIGGRLLGYWASFLWVVAPFAAIPLFVDRYQERWTEHFLPQALGLTTLSDFPSMVIVLAAAFFVVRSLDAGRLTDAVLAGLLLGAAAGTKPPNALMASGPRWPTSSPAAGARGSPSASPSCRRCSSSCSGRSAGSVASPRSGSRRPVSSPARPWPSSGSTSTTTSS